VKIVVIAGIVALPVKKSDYVLNQSMLPTQFMVESINWAHSPRTGDGK
jgi:hypothetical protein